MDGKQTVALGAVVVLAGAGVAFAGGLLDPLITTGGYEPTDDTETPDGAYDHATVTVIDSNGTNLAELRVAVADTHRQRYTGLSETDSLPEDRGMLFVYNQPDNHTYVMRGMDFGIDIVYVDANMTITQIHHAPKPPADADGESFRYPGHGQYVLEVNLNWTTRHDVDVGDRLRIRGYEG